MTSLLTLSLSYPRTSAQSASSAFHFRILGLSPSSPKPSCEPTPGKPMPRVLITPSTLANIDAEFIPVLRRAGFDLVFPNKGAQLDENELFQHLPGIDATLAGS